MSKLSAGCLIVLLAIAAAACRRPKELVYRDVQNIRVTNVGLKQTVLAANVLMYNPNRFSLQLRHANVDVYLNDKHVGNVLLDSLFTIPRKDSFSLPLSMAIDMSNVIPGALQLLFNSEVDLKITGFIKAGKRGIYLAVPVNYEARQDITEWMK